MSKIDLPESNSQASKALGQVLSPAQAMALAIKEAHKGDGFVAPNPLVGCAILDKDGRLISLGYHPACGQEHAEVNALSKVQDRKQLEGAHVLVTLEPCSHQGRTPACAEHLSRLPLKKVTYGLMDPNPLVSGRGAEILKQAGIEVEKADFLQEELAELCEIFVYNMKQQASFLALKVATSLDGQIAIKSSGESRWITGEEARLRGHYLRGCYDAVMVGAQTLTTDDPRLTIRHPHFENKKRNRVVVIDGKGGIFEFLRRSQLIQHHDPKEIFVVTQETAKVKELESLQVNIVSSPLTSTGHFDIQSLQKTLYQQGVTSLYCEGGAGLHSSILQQRCGQRLYAFIAPKIIGARDGRAWTETLNISSLDQCISLSGVKSELAGSDILLTGRLFSRTCAASK